MLENILTSGERTHANNGNTRIIRFCTEIEKVESLAMNPLKMVVVANNQEIIKIILLLHRLEDVKI